MSTLKAIQSFKNKVGLSLALLFLLIIGASTIMAMKAPVSKIKNEATTSVAKKQTSYSWFQISGNQNIGAADSPANSTYLGSGVTPPAGSGCSGSNYQCVSGFSADQVTSSNQLNGSQIPKTTPRRHD